MAVIFNVFAVLQAIIGVAVVGILHLLLNLFGFDYDMIGGTREAFVSLVIIAAISAYTDAKGLKGTLFYLPMWLVVIAAAIFVFSITYNGTRSVFVDGSYQYVEESLTLHKLFLYGASLLISLGYIRLSRKELAKTWQKKKTHLELLKAGMQAGEVNPQQFWEQALLVYYKPSNLFLYLNYLWKPLFANAIDGDEFLQYYRDFINLIDIDQLAKKRHKVWTSEFRTALNQAKNFNEYSHPMLALARLRNTIDQNQNPQSVEESA